MEKTLGGDRLGSGKKQKVHLHGYERSTHDMSYLWRSTMSAGTLVPFICEVALPGDTFDITLNSKGLTHPTIGPLFGSYKAQYDVFQCPIRLYQGQLHNNKLGIGMKMAEVKLPLMQLYATNVDPADYPDIDNAQINPSCILSYLGIRGIGLRQAGTPGDYISRLMNAVPLLAYWDIYKQYYANKQEEKGAVIKATAATVPSNITTVTAYTPGGGLLGAIPQAPTEITFNPPGPIRIEIVYVGVTPDLSAVLLNTNGTTIYMNQLTFISDNGSTVTVGLYVPNGNSLIIKNWDVTGPLNPGPKAPQVELFDLNQIDEMREYLLSQATVGNAAVIINNPGLAPYKNILPATTPAPGAVMNTLYSQEGLGIKTYQSDLFNNWLSTEWIDGAGGISEVTAIDTSGGSFTIDTLVLSRKVYNMLNRIAVSGGTYDDWLDSVYDHERFTRAESPIYHGGLSKEIVFQEVISNSASESQDGEQPLGTLAGKGAMSDKHKGGRVTIKVDEPSYIIGIVSLTPRLDYSQGNKWDTDLKTMDDFHKPQLDEIGFQELITEQMHWASTTIGTGPTVKRSAGKQPAWINYMTNVNQVRGNFAVDFGSKMEGAEMFMTLNRRYEMDLSTGGISDLTTYIDPVKFNHIFAQTAIDAQNFWMQISVDMEVRRKMSNKVMPNL